MKQGPAGRWSGWRIWPALIVVLLADASAARVAGAMQMASGTYTGDGATSRAVTGVVFRPDALIVKGDTAQATVMRTAMTGDAAKEPTAGAVLQTQRIRSLDALAITSVNAGAHPIAGVGFPVVVEARSANGAARSVQAATSVRLGLKTGSGSLGGTLSGTIPAGMSQVVITGVTYTKAESGVVLTVARTSGDAMASGDGPPFTTEPGAIAGYTVSLPSPQSAGVTFAVAVTALDQFANRVTTDNSTLVTLASSSGHVRFDGNLDGTFGDVTRLLSAGAASLNARGTTAETTSVTVTDTNGKTGSASLTVKVGTASTLAFTTQPGTAMSGSVIPGPPTVAVQDGYGNTITSSKAAITVAIGTNPGGGTLAGTTKKSATAGVASFANLTISKPGSGYTLTATAAGLAAAMSSPFLISGPTGSIAGRVTAATDGTAVVGATVEALQAGTVKASTSSRDDGTYALAALATGSYDVRVSAIGYQSQTRTGATVAAGSTTTVNVSLGQVSGPSIRITSPAPGSVITSGTLFVRGEVSAPVGRPAGIAVNGVPGVMDGAQFVAVVPVDSAVTSLTASLNDLSGMLAGDTVAISVSASSAGAAVRLQTQPSGGVPPLPVRFRLSNLFATGQITLKAGAPGISDFQGTSLQGVTITYTRPGVYVPTAHVVDTAGRTYTAEALVQVFDRAALDSQLQATWNGFKDALRAGNVAGASSYLHTDTRAAYQARLSNLGAAALAAIDQVFTTISLVEIGFGGAQYEMLRQGPDKVLSYAVWFQIDQDGIWRLRRF